MPLGKPLVQSKEFWFNLVMFILAVLALPEFIHVLPVKTLQYLPVVTAIGNVFIRVYFTSQPISGIFH